jgi:DNA-binding transcriptional LysR family regulator
MPGFIPGSRSSRRNFGETVLIRLPLHLVVPAGHPFANRQSIPFSELSDLPLVLPSEPHPLRTKLAKLAREKGLTLGHIIEANSIHLQHEVAACQGGFAITSGTLIPQEIGRLAAVRIVQPEMSRVVVLAVTSHRAHTRATLEVGRLLRNIAPAALQVFQQAPTK